MMKTRLLTLTLALSWPLLTFAQAVPALDTEVRFLPGSYQPIPLRKTAFTYPSVPDKPPQEQNADTPVRIPPETVPAPPSVIHEPNTLWLQDTWRAKLNTPVLSQDGSITFPYGASLPSIICAPLHVCEVSLQPGETIQQLDVGDPTRWAVKLARSVRDGVETSHMIIKPSDVGIVSNLVAITDRRTYTVQLVSKMNRSWMPKVAFSYPDDMQANWNAYFAAASTPKRMAFPGIDGGKDSLDFNYRLKGDKPIWRPLRVYTDQVKTYIQLPPAVKNAEIPVLVLLGPDTREQLVNYRLDGEQFIVDKVIQRAALVSGVGRHQERVDIVREGS